MVSTAIAIVLMMVQHKYNRGADERARKRQETKAATEQRREAEWQKIVKAITENDGTFVALFLQAQATRRRSGVVAGLAMAVMVFVGAPAAYGAFVVDENAIPTFWRVVLGLVTYAAGMGIFFVVAYGAEWLKLTWHMKRLADARMPTYKVR